MVVLAHNNTLALLKNSDDNINDDIGILVLHCNSLKKIFKFPSSFWKVVRVLTIIESRSEYNGDDNNNRKSDYKIYIVNNSDVGR